MKHKVTMVVVAAITLLTASAFAQPPAGANRGFGGGRLGDIPTTAILQKLGERLDLTDAQKTNIEAILTQAREDLKGATGKMREVMEATREKIAAELTDAQKAKFKEGRGELLQAFGGFMAAHRPEIMERAQQAGGEIRMRMALTRLDGLTDEQRTKLQEIGKETREKGQAIRDEVKPKLEALKKEADEKLRGVLTEEQKKQLDTILSEMPAPGEFAGKGQGAGKALHGGKAGRGPRANAPADKE